LALELALPAFVREPQSFFFGSRYVFEFAPAIAGKALHLLKAPHELGIGIFQSDLRIDVEKARQIDRCEEQVAKLFFHLRLLARLQSVLDLAGLFPHLIENAVRIVPIKASARGFLGELQAFQRRWNGSGHSVQRRLRSSFHRGGRAGRFFGLALLRLNPVPVPKDFGGVFRTLLAKDVRMPPDHFFMNGANHVGNVETTGFRGDLRMKGHLKEKIAQLFDKFLVVATLQRVQHLVSLFDEIRSQRVMGLLAVPRAATWIAQTLLNRDQFLKPVARREARRVRIFSSGGLGFPGWL
jgi:hypothetical protein